ncbi:MAG: amidohydrolase family protein [Desulfobacterales bacterium]|nr:amidohydrolase family protein [Desulfobacterales bacterium]
MTQRIAIKGVTLIDGNGEDPLKRGVVIIEGSTIQGIGHESEINLADDVQVIDASGTTVMPGIIDAHVHLGGASYKEEENWVIENDTYQAISSVGQANKMLRYGITSVRDISVNGPHLRKAIMERFIDGPRIVPTWRGLSRRGGHGDAGGVSPEMVRTSHPWGIVADGVDEVRKITREIIKNGSHGIKVWASGGGLHENEPSDAQHYSFEELKVMVEEANYARIPLLAHCECASAARDAVMAGAWSIEHGEELDEETIHMMAQKGVSLVPTLFLLNQWFEWSGDGGFYGTPFVPGGGDDLPSDKESLRPILWERLSSNLMAAKAAGVRIGLGSDSFCNEITPYGEQSLNELKALVEYGMSSMEAIVAATKNGSEILKIDDITGTLEIGKSADLIILQNNPLDDINFVSESGMLAIMKEGKFIKNLIN